MPFLPKFGNLCSYKILNAQLFFFLFISTFEMGTLDYPTPQF